MCVCMYVCSCRRRVDKEHVVLYVQWPRRARARLPAKIFLSAHLTTATSPPFYEVACLAEGYYYYERGRLISSFLPLTASYVTSIVCIFCDACICVVSTETHIVRDVRTTVLTSFQYAHIITAWRSAYAYTPHILSYIFIQCLIFHAGMEKEEY